MDPPLDWAPFPPPPLDTYDEPHLEDEEQDVCRVCRDGVDSGPLCWPCSCSGSVRFVHEACLAEWLARSKKGRCELCGSPFRYTKVFRDDMPEKLPFLLLARHFAAVVFSLVLLVLRAILVAVAWLVVLPYSTLWVFRFYLTAADMLGAVVLLLRMGISTITPGTCPADVPVRAVLSHPTCLVPPAQPWRRLLATIAKDTFAGQILTSLVVVLFVLCFLLREWVGMHALPGGAIDPAPAPEVPQELPENVRAAVARLAMMDLDRRREERAAAGPLELLPPAIDGEEDSEGEVEAEDTEDWTSTEEDEVDDNDDELFPFRNRPRPRVRAAPRMIAPLHRRGVPMPPTPPPLELLPPEPHAAAAAAAAAAAPAQDDEFDEHEDMFGGDDAFDDFEGVLEAIGMTGSLLILVQNMGLMNLLIALCLGATVWIPLVLGRALAAGNAVLLIVKPLLLVRSISDPFFDFVFSPITSRLPAPTSSSRPALVDAVHAHWVLMATSTKPLHRGLCVALGYATVLGVGIAYVRGTRNRYRESFDRAVRDALFQQLLFLKVAGFVFVEIVIFPATCGLVLSLSTLSLFPDTTIWTRMAFHSTAPLSSFFLTWLAGTAFMFSFSLAIDTIRDSVRRGVMWFIRDPASADLHPIREILERDTVTQARKIAVSAVLYAAVILATFGVNIHFLRTCFFNVLPLRWKFERPFSFPLDLLLFRFAVPVAIYLTDPPARLLQLFRSWARTTARLLRLTSFIFGQREASEEGTHVRRTWRARLTLRKADLAVREDGDEVTPREVVFRPDGSFARVPAVDNIRVAPGRRMLVRVTEEGVPLDDEGAGIIRQQLVEMATTRTGDRYQVVYLPPWFRTRVALFVYLLWLTGSLASIGAIVVPLVVGRHIFDMFTTTEVHDIYSFALGLVIVGTAASLAHLRPSLPSLRATATSLESFALLGVLLPLLSSFALSSFIILPLSRGPPAPALPEINVPLAWATGTVILSSAYHLRAFLFPRHHVIRASLEEGLLLWHAGERISALAHGNRTLLRPLAWRLMLLLGLPAVAVLAWPWEAPHSFYTRCRIAFGLVGGSLVSRFAANKGRGITQRWMTRLREDEFLLEKRLQNFDGQERTKDDAVVVD